MMRTGFGHAVSALRHYPCLNKLRDHLARRGRSGNTKSFHHSRRRQFARFHFSEKIHRVGRNPHNERGADLDHAIERAGASRQIVNDDFGARGERHDQRSQTKIVAERTHRIDDGLGIEAPIGDHRARIGQQRIVAVHDPFGASRRS